MGVHDFVDFVQRNGQCLMSLELHNDGDEDDNSGDDDGAGCGSAIIVLVPLTYTKIDILSWPLSEFAKFQKREAEYSWDAWDFKDIKGYSDILSGDDKKWWDLAIWISPTIRDHYLVNFEPSAYNAFVLGKGTASQLPWNYIDTVFSNRDLPRPPTKELAFAKILDSRQENMFEYSGSKLEPLEVPLLYTRLYDEVVNLPVFSERFRYRLQRPPPQLSKARVSILIKDHIAAHPTLRIRPSLTLSGGETSFCLDYNAKEAIFAFNFWPVVPITLDDKYDDACIYCWKQARWMGSYMCIIHQAIDVQPCKDSALAMIRSDVIELCQNLESLRLIEPPPTITAKFTEKGTTYDLILSKSDA